MSQKLRSVVGLIALGGLFNLVQAQINWSSAGPVYTAGRARNLIVDKNDATGNTLYVGSASSGIFKSTDAGSNWAPINDQGSVRNISYLAQSVDGTIWATTGEGFLRYGQKTKAQRGTGLYKLNGTSLTQVQDSVAVGAVINRIACSPIDNKNMALATNKGILISTDGGASFTPASLTAYTTTFNVTYGMDLKFDVNGILYCTIGNERGNHLAYVGGPNYTNVASKVFKSTDATLSSFTNITPSSTVFSDMNYGRIELAVAPTNPNVIYASCANKNISLPGGLTQVPNSASLRGVFVSYNAGQTWALLTQGSAQLDPLSDGGTISSGDYAHVMLVSPASADQLFIGGYSFYVFNRTSGSNASPVGNWAQIGSSSAFLRNFPYFLNQNIHDIKIVLGNPVKFYFVTDAGIYRSTDLVTSSNIIPPTFQPFYKGLVTGQFNSVSIERYPITQQTLSNTATGSSVTPYTGFIGGTGANGFNYYSGNGSSQVTKEVSYMSGDVYNAEYSKILNGAAFMSQGNGDLYKSTNVTNSPPTKLNINSYAGALSRLAPVPAAFYNTETETGTQFRLWENYGQIANSPDAAVFYNDSLRFQYSFSGGVSGMIAQTSFSFSAARPSRFAMIDSIAIRTATVTLPVEPASCPIAYTETDRKDIRIKLPNNYTVTSGAVTTSSITGPAQGAATINLNSTSLQDEITVNFSVAPFATKTATIHASSSGTVTDPSSYYRVYATVFYKYKAGDTVKVNDNNISTKVTSYSKVLTQPLNWAYGTLPSFTLSATVNTAIPNPTYVLNPGNISQTNPVFTVSPQTKTSYTITERGTYTLAATPVSHTLVAATQTAAVSPTYILNPGSISQSNPTFVVQPTVTTTYTLTEVDSGTLTPFDTFSTIANPSYELNPGSITQTTSVFVVSPTIATTYTLLGISSDTVTGSNTNITYTSTIGVTSTSVNSSTLVPFSKNNPLIKIPTIQSARLAMILKHEPVTGDGNKNQAVVVSKAPLNLNDPLNVVRVSQNGCLSDTANGVPALTTTISITGKPILLEWAKQGTELYYATNDNKLYRVSHITDIMDLSPSSYSGKFYTDVFSYAAPINAQRINPNSPYRTTLIGSFDKPITSISVSNDDKFLAVTFNNPTQTGTTGIVMYNTVDVRTANISNVGWVRKDATNDVLKGNLTYCSLMEKDNSKTVFIGTDNGMFYTTDITAATPVWKNVNDGVGVNNKLPNVQVFDIKQQTLNNAECYNSGQIYVATNGRGVWATSNYFSPYYVGIAEESIKQKAENNLSLFPNPTSGNVTILFDAVDGEDAVLNIMDLSGRIVKTENIGKLSPGSTDYSFDTNSLSSGIYIVSVNSNSKIKRVSKLVVTK